jgi:hypothetical protein
MATARYGDRMAVHDQGEDVDTKEKESHKETV